MWETFNSIGSAGPDGVVVAAVAEGSGGDSVTVVEALVAAGGAAA